MLFILVPQLHLLDLAGPAQVFSSLDEHYTLGYLAEAAEVPTTQGVVLQAGPLVRPDPDDLVVVPGWRGSMFGRPGLVGEPVLDLLRDHHAAGGTVASVCAGADALGRAGLLDGRRCTTHHALQDRLAALYPRASVVRDVLYVVDGRVVTSAGIASGIDLALHLVAVRLGPAVAARVAREMVVYARRNGDDPQRADADPGLHRRHRADAVAVPAGAAAGAGRAPDRPWRDRRVGRPGGRVRRRPDAPPPPRPPVRRSDGREGWKAGPGRMQGGSTTPAPPLRLP